MKDSSGRVIGFEKLNFSVAAGDVVRVVVEKAPAERLDAARVRSRSRSDVIAESAYRLYQPAGGAYETRLNWLVTAAWRAK